MADPVDGISEDESRLVDLLDRYLELVQVGEMSGAEAFLSQHPELSDYVDCLGRLDALLPSTPSVGESDSAPDVPAVAGSRFGRYELLEQIGRGAMGVVHKARQIDLDRLVALKLILRSRLDGTKDVSRFYSEARAAARLRHPNIVGVLEVDEVHGQHFLAMDYIEGVSLSERLRLADDADGSSEPSQSDSIQLFSGGIGRIRSRRRHRVDPDTAARWVSEISRAVDYLHSQGVIHRDLKPSNILLDAEDRPLVTDFGLARVLADESTRTAAGTIVGTPGYLSPEQAAGREQDVTPRSDIFSLGVILYELLTGQAPFAADSPVEMLMRVLDAEPPPPSRIDIWLPRDLDRICLKCLAKNPHQRYDSAAELADDLERFLRREPVEVGPDGFWQRVRRWGRRQPALVSRLVALAVTAAAFEGSVWVAGADYPSQHLAIILVLALWAAACSIFQLLLNRPQTEAATRYAWGATDAVLLTSVLYLADAPPGPLLIGYPLLVVASGLFFRTRLVWFMTAVTLGSFGALLVLRFQFKGELVTANGPWHYPVIFAAVLVVLGTIMGYQVYRLRALSRYFRRGGGG